MSTKQRTTQRKYIEFGVLKIWLCPCNFMISLNNDITYILTLLYLWAVVYGPRLRTPGPSNLPSTSPLQSFRNILLCGPSNILASAVALQHTPKQAHVLQELNGYSLVTELIREKYLVCSTVFPQHPTSVWWTRHERHLLRTFIVIFNKFAHLLHHSVFESDERILEPHDEWP